MAQENAFTQVHATPHAAGIRKIGLHDLWQALGEGFDDFNAKPSFGVFLCVFYPLFALLLTLFLVGQDMLHLAFPMVSGFTLLGPVVSVGLFEMSRRRERGLDVGWKSAFGFVRTSAFAPILALSIAMTLLYVAWLFMAQFLYTGQFGAAPAGSISEFATQVFTTRRGVGLIVYGTALGFLFAVVALAISVVAFPMLLDKQTGVVAAVGTSIKAVTTNPVVMAVWGLIVVALLAVGALVFLIGLAVVLPILGHATWHLYRKLVAP